MGSLLILWTSKILLLRPTSSRECDLPPHTSTRSSWIRSAELYLGKMPRKMPQIQFQSICDRQAILFREVPRSKQNANCDDPSLPGSKLGAKIEQHFESCRMALENRDPQLRTFKNEADLKAQVAHFINSNKPTHLEDKKDKGESGLPMTMESLRTLVQLNYSLELESSKPQPLLDAPSMDMQQRALVKTMPQSTTLGGESAPALAQLKCRFAVAKGKHTIQYHGFDGANQLLRFLADQNSPNVKVVLQLSPDASVTSHSDRSCGGVFEACFDVRGYLIPPKTNEKILDNNIDMFNQLARLENDLLKVWDTCGFETEASGSGPATALALCAKAMKHLAMPSISSHTSCVIVQWLDDSPGKRLNVILAETDKERRGMLLLNTPAVIEQAKRRMGQMRGSYDSSKLTDRLLRSMTASDEIRRESRYPDDASYDSHMSEVVRPLYQGFGSIWMPKADDAYVDSDSDDSLH